MKQLAKLEIDGQTYELGYDFNSLADAEPIAGANLLSAIEALGAGEVTAAQLRGLLYAMIVPWKGFPEKPVEALRLVGGLVRVDTLRSIYQAIGEACAVAVSEEYAEQYRAAMREPEPQAETENAEPIAAA